MTSLTQLCLPMHRLGDTGMRNTEPKRWPSSNSWIGGESAAISSTMSLGNPEIIPRARSSSSRRPPRSPFLDNFRVADQPETIPFADTSACTDPVKLPTNWLVLAILLRLIIRRPRLILETASSITVAKPRPRRLCKSALKCCLSGLKKMESKGGLMCPQIESSIGETATNGLPAGRHAVTSVATTRRQFLEFASGMSRSVGWSARLDAVRT